MHDSSYIRRPIAMSKISSKELAEPCSDEESDDDNEGLGLVSKDDRRVRKYYDSRKSPSSSRCCCESRTPFLIALIGTIVVFVVVLVVATVGLVVTYPRGNVSKGHGNKTGSMHSGGSDAVFIGEEIPWGNIRLQSSVIPQTYDIHLTVDLDSFQVTGSVSIACSVQSSVDYISLHAVAMTISGHTLHNDNGEVLEHNEVLYPENDFFIFNLTEPLEPGLIVSLLQFNYTLGNDLVGFYRSFYTDVDKKKRYLASTQFEATDARKAFPCFDEPSLKANFSLHVTHNSRYRAWFNMPAMSRTRPNPSGMVTTLFQTSLKMSTYLVAFVVSDFQCIKDTMVSISGNEVAVREITNPCPPYKHIKSGYFQMYDVGDRGSGRRGPIKPYLATYIDLFVCRVLIMYVILTRHQCIYFLVWQPSFSNK